MLLLGTAVLGCLLWMHSLFVLRLHGQRIALYVCQLGRVLVLLARRYHALLLNCFPAASERLRGWVATVIAALVVGACSSPPPVAAPPQLGSPPVPTPPPAGNMPAPTPPPATPAVERVPLETIAQRTSRYPGGTLQEVVVLDRAPDPGSPVPCTLVGEQDQATAGTFRASEFVTYRLSWPRSAKLAWQPADERTAGDELLVTATNLSSPDDKALVYRYNYQNVYAAIGPTGGRFFPTVLLLPERGMWRLVARAGSQEGCFDFRF